jgi:hypothetical protein
VTPDFLLELDAKRLLWLVERLDETREREADALKKAAREGRK